jgi:hypothetical protein
MLPPLGFCCEKWSSRIGTKSPATSTTSHQSQHGNTSNSHNSFHQQLFFIDSLVTNKFYYIVVSHSLSTLECPRSIGNYFTNAPMLEKVLLLNHPNFVSVFSPMNFNAGRKASHWFYIQVMVVIILFGHANRSRLNRTRRSSGVL